MTVRVPMFVWDLAGFELTCGWAGLGSVVVFMTTLFALGSSVSPGFAALVIVQASMFAEASRQLVRYGSPRLTVPSLIGLTASRRVLAQVELDFNSVERIVEYLGVPQEAPAVVREKRPPAAWPSRSGELVVEDLVVKYAPHLPAVLKKLSFSVKPSEKIGIVRVPGRRVV